VSIPVAPRLTYRPELDGLRAIAALLVIAAHLALAGFDGAGRVGYHIFFVLSGFLITTILIDEHRRIGRIDLRRFYVRRMRRLFPALVALVLIVLLVETLEGRGERTAFSALASVTYVANWMSGCQTLGVFCHTWTLAVEEQFYLAWPLLLILGLRGGRWAIGALAGAVAVWLWLPGFWALEVGCAAGIAIAYRGRRPRLTLLLGPALVILALGTAQEATGLALVLVTVAAAVVIVDGSKRLNVILTSPPLVALGRWSYGIYLWHLPVLVWLGRVLPELDWSARTVLGIAASITAGWLSSRLVEQWFRRPSVAAPEAEAEHAVAGIGAERPDDPHPLVVGRNLLEEQVIR
jgi:peptidoglycan/LPS O-acetylase OafA/YrhL